MARLQYGGTPGDVIVAKVPMTDDNDDVQDIAALAGGIPLQVWDSLTGGEQFTDLLDLQAQTLAGGLVVTTADGRLPYFYGPDLYTADLYVADPVSAARYRVTPGGVAQRVADLESGQSVSTVTLATAQTITAPKILQADVAANSALVFTRSVTVDPLTSEDLFAILYKGQRASWFNEWGGFRSRVPLFTDLGYADVALAIWARAGNDALQLFASADGGTPSWRVREGDMWAKAITASGTITAAAPTTAAATITGGAGQWQDFTFAAGYTAYAAATQYTPKGRVELGADMVQLRGRIVTDGTIGVAETVCTLPAALRPVRTIQVFAMTSSGSVTQLDIASTGVVTNQRALTTTWISLDDVRFFIGAN